MEKQEHNKMELFAENVQTIKKEFIWQNTLTKRMAALLYAQEGKKIDCDAIRQCHTLIKKNTGVFSAFRGDLVLCVSTLLSLTQNPQEVFRETLKVYDLLKGAKFYASDYLVIASYQIATHSNTASYRDVVARTRGFYEGMKERHFFYTGQDDYIFSSMLGLSDLEVHRGTQRIEQLFLTLKSEFWDKNSIQALAQVLVLNDSDESSVRRVLALRDELRGQKIKLDRAYTLPILGVLALLPVEIEEIVRKINETREFLREQKGFGSLSISTQELLMFAAAIVVGDYAKNIKDGVLTATLSTSITNIMIAQHAAMIAAISASAAAASSAASS